MKAINTSLKTMGIKARVTNIIRKDIYLTRVEDFSEKAKVALFNKWFQVAKEVHNELNTYKAKRKYKAKVEKQRLSK